MLDPNERERIRDALTREQLRLEPDALEVAELDQELPDQWAEPEVISPLELVEMELEEEVHTLTLEPDAQDVAILDREVPNSWAELETVRDELNAEIQRQLEGQPERYSELGIVEENFRDKLYAELEAQLQAHPELWEQLRLEPDAQDVAALDRETPQEWLQELELSYEEQLDQDINRIAAMSDKELAAHLDVPEGDIVRNAHQAIQELDIFAEQIIEEARIDQEPTPQQDHDFDFGR